LLHGHDFLDVSDIGIEGFELFEDFCLFFAQVLSQVVQVVTQLHAFRILGEERRQVILARAHQRHNFCQT